MNESPSSPSPILSRACTLLWVRDLVSFGAKLEQIGWAPDAEADTPFAERVYRLGGAVVGLVEDPDVGPTAQGRRRVALLVEVPDVEAARAGVVARLEAFDGGATPVGEVTTAGGERWFALHDPVGTEVRYVERASAEAFGGVGAARGDEG